jgi:hypothetical protein
MREFCFLLIALALFALLVSCSPPLGSSSKATVAVHFGARARTVAPQADLGISSIAVTVTHLGGTATGSAASISETCTIGDILLGSATISAVASNGTNTVASGSAPLDVVPGANVVTIDLVPDSGGTGSFALAMSWPETTGATFVECSLRDALDTEVDAKNTPTLTPVAGTYFWTYQGSANSGVYTLFITFRSASGGTVLGTFIESVNVFKNLESNSWLDGDGIPRALRDFSAAELKDSLATLSKLVVTGAGLSNVYAPPVLAPGATIAMGKTTSPSISFAPTLVADTGQTISYTWNGGEATSISSGSSAGPLALVDGAAGNTLVITVAASSGQSPTYTVTIVKAYALSYDGNGSDGGSVPSDSALYANNQPVVVLARGDLSRSGFAFLGWSADPFATIATYAGDGSASLPMPAANLTLYAVWSDVPPSEVTGLNITAAAGSLSFSWTPPPETDFAGVEVSWTGGGSGTTTVPKGTNDCTIPGLTDFAIYTFTLRTYDNAGNFSAGTTCQGLPGVVGAGNYPVTVPGGTVNVDVSGGSVTISSYAGNPTTVVIPASINGLPVTTVGSGAFINCSSLQNVTIPDSVTRIGDYAFNSCTNLTALSIPASVTSIGVGALAGLLSVATFGVDPGNPNYSSLNGALCDKAQTRLITCPSGFVGPYAIPPTVTTLEIAAFQNCLGLSAVSIPNTITLIPDSAFNNSGIMSVDIPDSVVTIESAAFSICTSLATVAIGASTGTIQATAFKSCPLLSTVVVRQVNPPTLGVDVFLGDPITSVSVPSASELLYEGAPGWSVFGPAVIQPF